MTNTDHAPTAPAAYAVAHLSEIDLGPEIATYLQRIDETLEPFGGRFLVHGSTLTRLEGDWGDASAGVVVISFPDRERAQAWYDSPAYQEILPLRTRNASCRTAILDGVPPGYRATDTLQRLLPG